MTKAVSHPIDNTLTGTVIIPGDKSISHRALMLSALGHGSTRITGLLESDDVIATANALQALSVHIDHHDNAWHVTGIGDGQLETPDAPLDMGNSGTSARLLMGILSGYPVRATFVGDKSLSKRPMGRVTEPLYEMGAVFSENHLPLVVQGKKTLKPITYTLPVASAQVKSAILLAGMHAKGVTTVIETISTRDHTERMLQAMGANIDVHKRKRGQAISIRGFQKLTNIPHIDIPSDPSSAAFMAVAALIVPGSDITLPNILMNEARIGLYATLIGMGADIEITNRHQKNGEEVADLRIRHSTLHGATVPAERVASMIDEFPILCIAAAFANGDTKMSGLAELRVKESDRLLSMYQGLKAAGITCEMGEDWLTVTGMEKPHGGCTINTHSDHRIAMSFLVLGLATAQPVTINDSASISTSFPTFIASLNGLGGKVV